jgi:thermostable 8-oxoguanine DNA glycosylase
MKMTLEEQRQIENEMIFRRMNEKVGTDLDAVDAMHVEDGNPHLVRNDDFLLRFKCECSDEKCEVRIPLKLSKYREIHADRSKFIVKTNHQIDSIEKVITEEENYNVVRKYKTTSEPGDTLKDTTIDNS